MAYKHILIAVDLSPESKVLVEKAVSMARPYNAKVSLIHVDVNYSDLYTGLIDVNLGDMQKRISEETHHALTELSTNAGYPITETLSGSGDLGQVLVDAIKKYDMAVAVTEAINKGTMEVIVKSSNNTSIVKATPAIGALKIPPIAPAAPQPTNSINVF